MVWYGVARAYKLAAVGNCAGTGTFMDSKKGCEAAATSLGLQDTSAQDATSAQRTSYPYGCYYRENSVTLYWNPDGDKNGKDTSRVSLCWVAGEFGIATYHPRLCFCSLFCHRILYIAGCYPHRMLYNVGCYASHTDTGQLPMFVFLTSKFKAMRVSRTVMRARRHAVHLYRRIYRRCSLTLIYVACSA